MEQHSIPIDVSNDSKESKQAVFDKDQQRTQQLDELTKEIVKGLEGFKEVDKYYLENNISERFKKISYVEREEDEELKLLFDKEVEHVRELDEKLKGKTDGVIDMDLHGNMKIRYDNESVEKPKPTEQNINSNPRDGIQDSGTYVLRNGKLVPGKGAVREQATFSNWYCSNADPEDIRKHRELMDRMHYRGPKWEGIGIPKSVIEEKNPVYRKVEGDPHPS